MADIEFPINKYKISIMKNNEELYEKIGSNIILSIKEPWIEGVLKIKVVLNSVDFNLSYTNMNTDSVNVKLENAYEVSKAVKLIYSEMIETKHKWNRAIFKIRSNNDFDIEFFWDQNLQDEIENLGK
jgi:hypothetical protein